METNRAIYIPRRPSTLNVTIGLILALLVIAAVRGVDLQHEFLRLLWPVLGSIPKFEYSLYWTAPSRAIAEAPLNYSLFGWPACLICLAVLGCRARYRRAVPVIWIVLLSIFAYFILMFITETLLKSYGIKPRRWMTMTSLHGSIIIAGCNIAIAFIAWRWTRSRIMLIGLLALALLAPIQHIAARNTFYFSRLITLSFHREIPSQFEQWLGPNLSDTWAAEFVQWSLNGRSPLYKSVPIIITTDTYIVDGTNGLVTKSYPDVVVHINIVFGIGYNAAVLLLALWVVFFNRWGRPGYCTSCNYNLAGLAPGSPCPECGTAPPSTITDAQ